MEATKVLFEDLQADLSGLNWVGFAYLFGSQARGEARPDSDVDVAVWLAADAAARA